MLYIIFLFLPVLLLLLPDGSCTVYYISFLRTFYFYYVYGIQWVLLFPAINNSPRVLLVQTKCYKQILYVCFFLFYPFIRFACFKPVPSLTFSPSAHRPACTSSSPQRVASVYSYLSFVLEIRLFHSLLRSFPQFLVMYLLFFAHLSRVPYILSLSVLLLQIAFQMFLEVLFSSPCLVFGFRSLCHHAPYHTFINYHFYFSLQVFIRFSHPLPLLYYFVLQLLYSLLNIWFYITLSFIANLQWVDPLLLPSFSFFAIFRLRIGPS